MEFEFDPAKSIGNRRKHGIDFIEAQSLWDDSRKVLIRSEFADEPRSLLIAAMSGKLWTAALTYRGRRIRIISVRRSRQKEIARYEGR